MRKGTARPELAWEEQAEHPFAGPTVPLGCLLRRRALCYPLPSLETEREQWVCGLAKGHEYMKDRPTTHDSTTHRTMLAKVAAGQLNSMRLGTKFQMVFIFHPRLANRRFIALGRC